jgi:glutamate-1-semialdehyde 2,1-aminomutase
METARSWTGQELHRLNDIIAEGERLFKERQPRLEARGVLAGGATSSWQIGRPQMIWLGNGEGSGGDAGRFVDNFGAFARALRG